MLALSANCAKSILTCRTDSTELTANIGAQKISGQFSYIFVYKHPNLNADCDNI